MKKASIEKMDNGYLLTIESDSMEKPQRWVENKLKKIFTHLAFFFLDGKSALREGQQ
uniref:Uncharacterized protein n=1 Tax=viral metagenome TaxID=1070528 RepID=A0A6M3IVA0_9ZZZZ